MITKEQIEAWRDTWRKTYIEGFSSDVYREAFQQLGDMCDLALQALRPEELPPELFDGDGVWTELGGMESKVISDHVSDVLDAVVKMIRRRRDMNKEQP